MFTRIAPLVIIGALSLFSVGAQAETYNQEKRDHPRIVKAINELRQAVKYLEAAPHDFGGHKAAAIAASHQAIKELQEALKYRAAVDTKRGK